MSQGFFTIEQWKRPKRGGRRQWIPVQSVDGYHDLAGALKVLEDGGRPGLYRVVQMQRLVWAEKAEGKLKLHKSHAMTREGMEQIVKIFEKDGGNWAAGEARRRAGRKNAKMSREGGEG